MDDAFDLCVVDGSSLDRLWEQVRRRKEREQPILLPVLLATSRPGVKMITRHLWRIVDELLITPIEKPELRARIEILLRVRSLSLALRERADAAERSAAGAAAYQTRTPCIARLTGCRSDIGPSACAGSGVAAIRRLPPTSSRQKYLPV